MWSMRMSMIMRPGVALGCRRVHVGKEGEKLFVALKMSG